MIRLPIAPGSELGDPPKRGRGGNNRPSATAWCYRCAERGRKALHRWDDYCSVRDAVEPEPDNDD